MYQEQLIASQEHVAHMQSAFLKTKSLSARKQLGQFFTGSTISQYMASLITLKNRSHLRILDAGAGTGTLGISAAIQCFESGSKSVHIVAYEVDEAAIPNLQSSLERISKILKLNDKALSFEIRCDDFILSRPDLDNSLEKFDIAVINPPYFKYSVKESPYAKVLSDLYRGDPNIYASFMAVVLACLSTDGQMISITPRSFTNGLYFKGLRRFINNNSRLELIHIFKHRDKIFKNTESDVLQENIICRFVKNKPQKSIIIRSSDCHQHIHAANEDKYPASLIIDPSNDEGIIRIPENSQEADILIQAEKLPSTFHNSGYFISTGRVVEHRTREYISSAEKSADKVPLYRPHNIKPLIAEWTGKNKKDVVFSLSKGHEKHTIDNDTYVLLKRFSSKDEKRRLVAGIHLKNSHECRKIGFGNKTNYIGVSNESLDTIEAHGIAAIFNSTFMDKYFRCISGNTQVNATEIRVMKFPNREQIRKIGEQVINSQTISTDEIDEIINSILRLITDNK